MATLPNAIFKYERFKVLSLQNLKSQAVYFASPSQFNDPYDCAITAGIAEPSGEDLEKIRQYVLSQPSVCDRVRTEWSSVSEERDRKILMEIVQRQVRERKKLFAAGHGVCCFSERNDNLLMWAHYGGRYRGFCLEFRTEYEPFKQLRKVKYVDAMPKLEVVPLFTPGDVAQIIDLYCTKASEWAYEREWRLLHENPGTLHPYAPCALKAVYFGPDIERQDMEKICLILAGQNPQVEYWRGKRSKDVFKVEFEQFSYIPPIHANPTCERDGDDFSSLVTTT